MSRESRESASEVDSDIAAVSLARVFQAVSGQETDAEDPGWAGIVANAEAMFGDGDDDLSLPDWKFAELFRRAYVRANGGEVDTEWDDLPPAVRVTWRAVARHLLNLFSMGPEEARQLERHEAEIAEWAFRQPGGPTRRA